VRGATPEELALAIHEHALRQLRKGSHLTWGMVQSVDGTVPPTLTITLRASTTQIPGVTYLESYTPSGNDKVAILDRNGDLLVLGTQAA
jgi:hypothetical protein